MPALNHNILCQNNFLSPWCADAIFLFFFSPFSIKKQLLVHKKFPEKQLSLEKKQLSREIKELFDTFTTILSKEGSAKNNFLKQLFMIQSTTIYSKRQISCFLFIYSGIW